MNIEEIKGRRKGTSSAILEVLMISCQTNSINLLRFSCLTSYFCFPKKYNFGRQKKTGCYGRVPLVLVIKCTREIDDLLKT